MFLGFGLESIVGYSTLGSRVGKRQSKPFIFPTSHYLVHLGVSSIIAKNSDRVAIPSSAPNVRWLS